MKNSQDQMERSRLRLKRLRKLAEQIKIEEEEYHEKFGDDSIKLILLKNSKMEFERRNRRQSPLIATSKIKFNVFKYFIDGGSRRMDEHCLSEHTLFYKKIKNVIKIHFKSDDYVTVVSNKHENHYNENRILFDAFVDVKRGKLTYAENPEEMPTEYLLHKQRKIKKDIIEVSNKYCHLDQLVYLGNSLENENVLLIGDEFGLDDGVGNLLLELKPKSILNILSNDKYTWFDNVD